MPAHADTDCRNRNRFGDDPKRAVGNTLEDNGETAGLGERNGIVGQHLGRVELLALHLEAAEQA